MKNFGFCPYDGEQLVATGANGESRPNCAQCGFIDYGNPKPCVAVLIVSDDKILLARRGIEPARGMWDIVGGFVAAGESAEDAARREALEETGLEIRIIRFLASFADVYGERAEPTLNLCFVAEPCGGQLAPESDVTELRWFARADLPANMAFTHQRQALRAWLDSRG